MPFLRWLSGIGLVSLFAATVLTPHSGKGAQVAVDEQSRVVQQMLQAPNFEDAQQTFWQLVARRRQISGRLANHIEGGGDYKYFAIRLLGELRAANAVDVLVEHIEYGGPSKHHFGTSHLRPLEQQCPAIYSLVNIGPICTDRVVEAAIDPDIEAVRRDACLVTLNLLHIRYGVRDQIERYIAGVDDEQRRRRIRDIVLKNLEDPTPADLQKDLQLCDRLTPEERHQQRRRLFLEGKGSGSQEAGE